MSASNILSKAAQKSTSPRGRPRGFDVKEVARQARDIFSRRGLSGTSLDEIATATGLFRTSLVAAFENKRGLFLRALEEYRAEGSERMAEALDRPNLRDALTHLFKGAIDAYVGTADEPPGCFLVSTAVLEASTDPDVGAIVAGHLRDLEAVIVGRLERERELPASAQALASVISSTLLQLAIRARAGASKRELQKTAAAIVQLVTASQSDS